MYSLSVPNVYIFAANSPGCVASVVYYVTTLPLIPPQQKDTRRSVQVRSVRVY